MKLRICVCLFAILSVSTLVLTVGYLSLRQDYVDLSRKYQTKLSQDIRQSLAQKQETGKKDAENGSFSIEGSDENSNKDLTIGENPGNGQEGGKVQASDAFYYVTLNESEIIAYTGDRSKICMRTEIDAGELAAVLIQELKQGIYLENLPALYEYLENCSS